jgi:DNA repair exonuclease SbcCD ATPase subunit
MRHLTAISMIFFAVLIAGWPARCAGQNSPSNPQQRDYLSDEEADQIREVRTPSERIKLYVAFAEDRLKKFDYELNRPTPERREEEILNNLLNGYSGCVDDGTDQIDLAREKQTDIREALKLMRSKLTQFLGQLQKYDQGGPKLDTYRDTLEDAIDSTKDALSEIDEASKEMLPPPVRRKQQ